MWWVEWVGRRGPHGVRALAHSACCGTVTFPMTIVECGVVGARQGRGAICGSVWPVTVWMGGVEEDGEGNT